jgi:hypothetical protein
MYYYAQVTHIGYPAGQICPAPGTSSARKPIARESASTCRAGRDLDAVLDFSCHGLTAEDNRIAGRKKRRVRKPS